MLIIILGRLMGIEPTNVGATIRCVNHFATIAMAGVAGIEPTLTVLETAVLPLNYTPTYLINGAGSRTWTRNLLITSQLLYQLSYSGIYLIMVAWDGIEPPTQGFSVLCSTDWATKPFFKWRSRRESNPRSPAWQAGMLTATPLDLLVAGTGLEPATFGLWARRATNCSTPRCYI